MVDTKRNLKLDPLILFPVGDCLNWIIGLSFQIFFSWEYTISLKNNIVIG